MWSLKEEKNDRMEKRSKIIGLTLLIIIIASGGLYYAEYSQQKYISRDYSTPKVTLAPPGINYNIHNLETIYSAGEKIKGTVNLKPKSQGSSGPPPPGSTQSVLKTHQESVSLQAQPHCTIVILPSSSSIASPQ